MLEYLPVEIISLISENLDNRSLLNFSLTSKEQNIVLENLQRRKEIYLCGDFSDLEIEEKIKLEKDLRKRKIYFEVQNYRKKIDLKVIKSQKQFIPHDKGQIRVLIYRNGQKKSARWYLNGQRHRTDGPACIYYYENGQKKYEEWYLNDKLHKTDGPAWITFYKNGQKEYEIWYLNDKLHKTDGPAWITFYKNGQKDYEIWYLNGQKQKEENYPQIS